MRINPLLINGLNGKGCDVREMLDLRREVTTGGMRRLKGGGN